MRIDEAFDFIREVEKDFNLWEYEFAGFKPWPAARMESVFYLLYSDFGISTDNSPKKIRNSLKFLKKFFNTSKFFLKNNLMNITSSKNWFITPISVERKDDEERSFNIFSDFFPKTWEKPVISYNPNNRTYPGKKIINDLPMLSRFADITGSALKTLIKLPPYLPEKVATAILRTISRRVILATYIDKVIKLKNPSIIGSITWYDEIKPFLFYAANRNGVINFELQHGIIHLKHPGYVTGDKKIHLSKMVPGCIFTWGRIFKEVMVKNGTYWDPEKIIVSGYPWLSYNITHLELLRKKAYKKLEKLGIPAKKKVYVLTTQIDTEQIIVEDFSQLKIPDNCVLILKIHPAEKKWYTIAYKDLLKRKNIYAVTDDEVSLYELLSIAYAHITYFSTVSWEAAAFGINNFIIDSPFTSLMSELIQLKLAKVIKIPDLFDIEFEPSKKNILQAFENLYDYERVIEIILQVGEKCVA